MPTPGPQPATGHSLTVLAPAKLNLSLAVLARRDDGFHEIESLMVPVSLADTLHVRRCEHSGVRLEVSFDGQLAVGPGRALARDVPADGRNLVVRAAERLARDAGATTGLEIELVKRIPSGAGLGGGSSDAAAVLMAAARLWNLDWPAERLARLAAEIGSDVPWFFAGGPAIASGRGERIDRVAGLPPLAAVIACPPTGLSTAAVYGRCVPDASRRGEAARLAAALSSGGLQAGLPFMTNALEPPARSLSPEVDALLEALGQAGGFAPRLTGSGSACFALARSIGEAESVAARLAAMRAGGLPSCAAVFVVRLTAPA
ncbi:MAG: 4-(cytidine 5'-diphospho)-2-C-methyl-D-erythritol kinase [Planctomycetia bacterium]|nr:4-(cytidine 5'-diphospho)-2-C-methyl-D-erythritol kinase [Planctomycetia bacterium]